MIANGFAPSFRSILYFPAIVPNLDFQFDAFSDISLFKTVKTPPPTPLPPEARPRTVSSIGFVFQKQNRFFCIQVPL